MTHSNKRAKRAARVLRDRLGGSYVGALNAIRKVREATPGMTIEDAAAEILVRAEEKKAVGT